MLMGESIPARDSTVPHSVGGLVSVPKMGRRTYDPLEGLSEPVS